MEGRAPRSSGDRRHAGPPGRPGSPRPSRRRHRSGLAVGARERVDPADSHDPLSRGARAPWGAAALGRQLPGPSQASPRCPGRPRRRLHWRRHTQRQQEPEGSALPSGREAGNRRCCRGLRSRRQRRRPHAPRVLTLTAHRHARGAAPARLKGVWGGPSLGLRWGRRRRSVRRGTGSVRARPSARPHCTGPGGPPTHRTRPQGADCGPWPASPGSSHPQRPHHFCHILLPPTVPAKRQPPWAKHWTLTEPAMRRHLRTPLSWPLPHAVTGHPAPRPSEGRPGRCGPSSAMPALGEGSPGAAGTGSCRLHRAQSLPTCPCTRRVSQGKTPPPPPPPSVKTPGLGAEPSAALTTGEQEAL